MRGRARTWNHEGFQAAVAKRTNFTDALRELDLRPAGGNDMTMKRHAVRLFVDTGHFDSERPVRGLRVAREGRRRSDDDVVRERSRVDDAVLRRHALDRVSLLRRARCGNDGEWRGMPPTLQLVQVNGRYDDDRLESVRWLRPNCHSQTPTFAGRESVRRMREAPPAYRRLASIPGARALSRPR